MKFLIVILGLLSIETTFGGDLDGLQFCREIKSDGMFGQPASAQEHCVSFKDDVMTDNADTFFGNPPESIRYVLVAFQILVVRNGELHSDYKIDEQSKVLKNRVGAALKLK